MVKWFAITASCLLCWNAVAAQPSGFIDLGKIRKYDTLLKRLAYYTDPGNTLSIEDVAGKSFQQPGNDFPFSPTKLNGRHFFKLSVTNSSPRDTFWFYPGKGQQYTVYVRDSNAKILKLLNNQFSSYSGPVFSEVPFCYLVVKQGTYREYYISTEISFYNWFLFDPVVLLPEEITSFTFEHLLMPYRLYSYVTVAFLGIMLTMLVYTFSIFLQTIKDAYLYYALAMLSFFLYFSLRWLDLFSFTPLYFFFSNLKYQLLQVSGNIFLNVFIVTFFSLKTNNPGFYTQFKMLILAQVIFLAVNIPLSYSNHFIHWGLLAFDIFRALVLVYMAILIAALIARRRDGETSYLGIGTVVSILLSGLALYTYKKEHFELSVLGIEGIPVLIFMLGILLQMIFYMQVLSHREKTLHARHIRAMENLKLDNDRKELEKFRAIIETRDQERNRISQEMHDDIGSGLTSIRLLSEIAKAKTGQQGAEKELEKISSTSNILIDKMNEIIWTLNSRNDNLPNLIAYMRHLIVEYFEPFHIHLSIVIPDDIREVAVAGKIRRNILLSVKEVLHNIVKHSRATEVQVVFHTGEPFTISISDNGIGFNPSRTFTHKNGLVNLKERLAGIGGSCIITNNEGTSIILKIPLVQNAV